MNEGLPSSPVLPFISSMDDPWATVAEYSIQNEPKIAVCAFLLNEARSLDEWIAFYWLQGVRKFFLYDGKSTDATRDVLAKYIRHGIVDLRTVDTSVAVEANQSTRVEIQMTHRNSCLKELQALHGDEGIEWVLFSDVDEFAYAQDPGMTLARSLDLHYKDQPCVRSAFIHRAVDSSSRITSCQDCRAESGLMVNFWST